MFQYHRDLGRILVPDKFFTFDGPKKMFYVSSYALSYLTHQDLMQRN